MKGLNSLCCLILATTMTSAQSSAVRYMLAMPEPWTHLFHVEIQMTSIPKSDDFLDLKLPAWRTGRYVILDFAGSVQEFSASDGAGSPLPWEKIDKQTWRIKKSSSTSVHARYKVFANEFMLRTKGLNDEGAFLDGATAFMYSELFRSLPITLTVLPYKNWHVTTGLDQTKKTPPTFVAPNYDYLADCPLFIGNQKDFEFTAAGTPHVLSIMGEGNYDADRMMDDLKSLVELHKNFWGRLPYDRFVFMLYLSPQHGGATEHLNSTILTMNSFMFNDASGYRRFLATAAHEIFHTWNVKQIRPRGINPYDWTKENYVKELWIAEGTTEYYESLLMVRAQFMTIDAYLRHVSQRIEDEQRRPGNRIQSAVESSFDAWVKHSRNHQNSYNAETDFYNRGADLSLALDLEIRQRSHNRHSLDDVMKTLFERFPLEGPGYTVEDFRNICDEFAGRSLRLFFEDHVYGTKLLDWKTLLSYAGLELMATPEEKPWLGVSTTDRDGRTMIRFVLAGSPAYDAGININDELIAVNGFRVRSADFSARIAELPTGSAVRLTIMRNDRLREFSIPPGRNPAPSYTVQPTSDPTPLQKAIFESWLNTVWKAHDSQSSKD